MSIPTFHARRAPALGMALPRPADDRPLLDAKDLNGRRRFRIWEILPNLHRSIVGSCLTTGELRQILSRLGQADAPTASDHELHTRGVRAAGRHDLSGKVLHKALDKRHDAAIKRMAGTTTADELLRRWRSALEEGNIPGGYWAALSHPACSRAVIREAFGEVHMLSHLVGQSNRLDLARLRKLEIALGERDAKMARQEARLRDAAAERSELLRKIEFLLVDRDRNAALDQLRAQSENRSDTVDLLARRLDAEQTRLLALSKRLERTEMLLAGERLTTARLAKRQGELQTELASLEAAIAPAPASPDEPPPTRDMAGLVLLYVGGRPGPIEHARSLMAARGGELLVHDGGVENNSALLPGLVSQADATFFPIDCISHHAAGQIKKLAKAHGKRFIPLRTASLASFVAAIADPAAFAMPL